MKAKRKIRKRESQEKTKGKGNKHNRDTKLAKERGSKPNRITNNE